MMKERVQLTIKALLLSASFASFGVPVGAAPTENRDRSDFNFIVGGIGLAVLAAGAMAGTGGDGDDSSSPVSTGYVRNEILKNGEMQFRRSKWVKKSDVISAAKNNIQANQAQIESLLKQEDFVRNQAFVQSNLQNRIALGFTGRGVKVGVMDFGVQWDNPNLLGVKRGKDFIVSDLGIAAVGSNGMTHGTGSAQVIAGVVGNGDLSRGVAPGVTLSDINYNHAQNGGIYAHVSDTAAAFNFVAEQKLDIVNWSMAIYRQGAELDLRNQAIHNFKGQVLDAVKNATSNGAIIVVAAGNNGKSGPDNIYAGIGLIDDVARGNFITVAALDPTGKQLAGFSNACGAAKAYCLSAVGVGLPVIDGHRKYSDFSGTSAATPLVSGSLALLREQFPELGSAELVELVFMTADDLGEKGVDAVFGRGALNMNAVMRPVGELRLVSGDNIASAAVGEQNQRMTVTTAMAGILRELDNKYVALMDDTNRAFLVPASAFASLAEVKPSPLSEFVSLTQTAGGSSLLFAGKDGAWVRHSSGVGGGYITPELLVREPDLVMDRGYHPLSLVDIGPVLTYQANNWSFGGAHSSGKEGADAVWLGFEQSMGRSDLRYSFGIIAERDSFFGSQLGGGKGNTAFASLTSTTEIGYDAKLITDVVLAKGRFSEGQGIIRDGEVTAVSARVGLTKENIAGGTVKLTAGIPMTILDGSMKIDVPIGREVSVNGNPTLGVKRSIEKFDFKSDAPIDIGVSYEKMLDSGLVLEARAVHRLARDGRDNDSYLGVNLGLRF